MIGEEASFLAAIRADIDDDTPRLVYADWLQEQAESNPQFTTCETCGGSGDADTIEEVNLKGESVKTRLFACESCNGEGRLPDPRLWRAELIRVSCQTYRIAHEKKRHPIELASLKWRWTEEEKALGNREVELCEKLYPKEWVIDTIWGQGNKHNLANEDWYVFDEHPDNPHGTTSGSTIKISRGFAVQANVRRWDYTTLRGYLHEPIRLIRWIDAIPRVGSDGVNYWSVLHSDHKPSSREKFHIIPDEVGVWGHTRPGHRIYFPQGGGSTPRAWLDKATQCWVEWVQRGARPEELAHEITIASEP